MTVQSSQSSPRNPASRNPATRNPATRNPSTKDHGTARHGTLGPRRRWAIYIIGNGVWLTGGLWLLFHYFLVRPGEYGPVANPLEPWWLKLHGAFAFAALWLFGLLWGVHIARLWPHHRRRWSGAALTAVLIVLVLTGYLLYYVGDDKLRSIISIIHWTIGLACPLAYIAHRLKRRPKIQTIKDPG